MKKASPCLTSTQLSRCSISPVTAASRIRSLVTGSRNPTPSCAPISARMTYHISVFPEECSCAAAKASSGWTCTESRPDVKTNFTSSGMSASNQTSPIFLSGAGNQGERSVAPQTFSLKVAGSLTGTLPFTDKLLDTIEPASQLSHRSRVGEADVLRSPEGFTGNDGDVRLREQAFGKLHGGVDAVAEADGDVRIGVEGAARLGDGDAGNGAQSSDDIIAPLLIFGEHDADGFLRAAKRFDGGFLRDRSGIRSGVVLQLHHRVDQRFWGEREADAPAGHGVSFRKRSSDGDVFLGAGHRSDGERIAVVEEAAVAFVGHQLDAAFCDQVIDALEFLTAEN